MYKLIKFNKKEMIYNFNTLEELDTFAEKQRYAQGAVTLELNGILIVKGSMYDVNSYCLAEYLAKNCFKHT